MEICVLSETLFQMFLMHWTESVYTVSLYSQCIEGMPHGLIRVACSIVVYACSMSDVSTQSSRKLILISFTNRVHIFSPGFSGIRGYHFSSGILLCLFAYVGKLGKRVYSMGYIAYYILSLKMVKLCKKVMILQLFPMISKQKNRK